MTIDPDFEKLHRFQSDYVSQLDKMKIDIWNEAIELAAKCAELNIDDCEIHNLIRKLRK